MPVEPVEVILTLLFPRLAFPLFRLQPDALPFEIRDDVSVEVAFPDCRIAGNERSGMTLTLVLSESSQCVMTLVGDPLPGLQITAIGVIEIRIGQGGLARCAIPFLAGVEVALVVGPDLGVVAHASDCGAGLIGEIWKACSTVTSVDITIGTGLPQGTQPPQLLFLLLSFDLTTKLTKDRRKDLIWVSRINRR